MNIICECERHTQIHVQNINILFMLVKQRTEKLEEKRIYVMGKFSSFILLNLLR